MTLPRIVIDTNVLVAALQSKRGASFKLLSLVGVSKFEFALSVPLMLEYEEAANRQGQKSRISRRAINSILDRLCFVAEHHEILFLWRPYLPDPKDDMILELAVASSCDSIISYNKRHFIGVEQFGLSVLTPKEFLEQIGELQ